jgi:hypothetical protein
MEGNGSFRSNAVLIEVRRADGLRFAAGFKSYELLVTNAFLLAG